MDRLNMLTDHEAFVLLMEVLRRAEAARQLRDLGMPAPVLEALIAEDRHHCSFDPAASPN